MIISFVMFCVYIIVSLVICKGIPQSISDTYYKLKRGWLFTVISWVVSFTLLPDWLGTGNPNYQCFAYLSCIGLAFLAAAPNFKCVPDRPVHIGGTVVCALSATIWVALHLPMLLLIWVAWAIYISIEMRSDKSFKECKPLFWAEITAFCITYSAISIV